jgi:hypothetical protein
LGRCVAVVAPILRVCSEGGRHILGRWRSTEKYPLGSRSVADLDAGPVPNPPIPIPNGGPSGPVACWLGVDRSRRYIDGSWAGYRRSKQCTNCQTTNNASGYLTTPSSRSPGCTRQANTACDKQTDQKLSHFQPLRMSIIIMRLCKIYVGIEANWLTTPRRESTPEIGLGEDQLRAVRGRCGCEAHRSVANVARYCWRACRAAR